MGHMSIAYLTNNSQNKISFIQNIWTKCSRIDPVYEDFFSPDILKLNIEPLCNRMISWSCHILRIAI